MKKEFAIHLFLFALFFLVLTLINQWLTPRHALFWLGGLVGTFLPDLDHLLYILFFRPYELTSQRAQQLMGRKEFVRAMDLLYSTRSERKHLVFHTALFQIIFLVLTYWVLASSSNLFGQGLVLAFSLHLVIDQFADLMQLESLENWFVNSPVNLVKEKATLYVVAMFLVISFLGIIL